MNTAELRLKLHREIETLENSKLEQMYGLLLILVNKEIDTEDWNTLTSAQQKGLVDAIEEMNSSNGIDHENIMEKYKKQVCLNQ